MNCRQLLFATLVCAVVLPACNIDVGTEVPADEPEACPEEERRPIAFNLVLRGLRPSEPIDVAANEQTFVKLIRGSRDTGLLSGIGEPTVGFIAADDDRPRTDDDGPVRDLLQEDYDVAFPDDVFVRYVDLAPGEYRLYGSALEIDVFACSPSK